MNSYFVTFSKDFNDSIEQLLRERFPDIVIAKIINGVAEFQTNEDIHKVIETDFIKNAYILINKMEVSENDSIPSVVKRLSATQNIKKIVNSISHNINKTFRIIISKNNQLASINKEIIHKLENKILLGNQFKLSPLKADYEFWFLILGENAYYGIRITGLMDTKRQTELGVLRSKKN